MKLALLGYYETGNFGDDLQGIAATRHLESLGHEVKRFSLCDSTRGLLITAEDIQQINEEYDAVIFAGCLLFQQWLDYWPVSRAWDDFTKPIAMLCVGADGPLLKEHKAFLERVSFLSIRHHVVPGLEDAIISDDLAFLHPFAERPDGVRDKLVVSSDDHDEWLGLVPQLAKRLGVNRVSVMATDYNPGRRSDIQAYERLSALMPGVDIQVPHRLVDASAILSDAVAVISSRRHAAILAALNGIRPVIVGRGKMAAVHYLFWSEAWEPTPTVENMERLAKESIPIPVTVREISQHASKVEKTIKQCIKAIEGKN